MPRVRKRQRETTGPPDIVEKYHLGVGSPGSVTISSSSPHYPRLQTTLDATVTTVFVSHSTLLLFDILMENRIEKLAYTALPQDAKSRRHPALLLSMAATSTDAERDMKATKTQSILYTTSSRHQTIKDEATSHTTGSINTDKHRRTHEMASRNCVQYLL